jgi:hypothetical protein
MQVRVPLPHSGGHIWRELRRATTTLSPGGKPIRLFEPTTFKDQERSSSMPDSPPVSV